MVLFEIISKNFGIVIRNYFEGEFSDIKVES